MGDRDSSAQGASSAIEKKIEDALREIDQIQKTKSLVKRAEQLEALGRRIVAATDKLAGTLVAQKVQDSIKDKELKEDQASPFLTPDSRPFEPKLKSWLRTMAITVAMVNEEEDIVLSQG